MNIERLDGRRLALLFSHLLATARTVRILRGLHHCYSSWRRTYTYRTEGLGPQLLRHQCWHRHQSSALVSIVSIDINCRHRHQGKAAHAERLWTTSTNSALSAAGNEGMGNPEDSGWKRNAEYRHMMENLLIRHVKQCPSNRADDSNR